MPSSQQTPADRKSIRQGEDSTETVSYLYCDTGGCVRQPPFLVSILVRPAPSLEFRGRPSDLSPPQIPTIRHYRFGTTPPRPTCAHAKLFRLHFPECSCGARLPPLFS